MAVRTPHLAPTRPGALHRLPRQLRAGQLLAEAAPEPEFLRPCAQLSRQARALALRVGEHTRRQHHLQQVEGLLCGVDKLGPLRPAGFGMTLRAPSTRP